MGAGKYGNFGDPISFGINSFTQPEVQQQHNSWSSLEDHHGDSDSESTMSSSFENSTNSDVSSSSLDLEEDASSPPEVNKGGPLYELSELMAHLPIKRGLSSHFQGKSQSFASLSNVKSLEDLAKRENPYRKRIKPCKSYAGGLDGNTNKSYAPKTCSKIISKKVSRGSFLSSLGKRNGSLSNSPRSPFSLQKEF